MRLRTEVGQIIFRHQNTATKGKEETLQPLLVVSKSDEHCKPLTAHEQYKLGKGFDLRRLSHFAVAKIPDTSRRLTIANRSDDSPTMALH